MPKDKRYTVLENVRLFFDEKSNTVRLTSNDPRLEGRNFSMQLSSGTVADESARFILSQELDIDSLEVDYDEEKEVSLFFRGERGDKTYIHRKNSFIKELEDFNSEYYYKSTIVPLGLSRYYPKNTDSQGSVLGNSLFDHLVNDTSKVQAFWKKDFTNNLPNTMLVSVGKLQDGSQMKVAREMLARIYRHAQLHQDTVVPFVSLTDAAMTSVDDYTSLLGVKLGTEVKARWNDFTEEFIERLFTRYPSDAEKVVLLDLTSLENVDAREKEKILLRLIKLLRSTRAYKITVVCVLDRSLEDTFGSLGLVKSMFMSTVFIGAHNLRQAIALGASGPLSGAGKLGRQAMILQENQPEQYFDII